MPVKMKKYIRDLTIASVDYVGGRYVHLKLTDETHPLPADILPGQFVQVRIDETPSVFLRRPISINMVDRELNQLWLLVAVVGDGTRWLSSRRPGDRINCVLPLGNGFTLEASCRVDGLGGPSSYRPLLVGGGVGVAPLLYLAHELRQRGHRPTIILGARTKGDLLLVDEFSKAGEVHVTTEDGTVGTKGFVTNDPLMSDGSFDRIQCCGPTPMMKAVARLAHVRHLDCEVSLENQMACGLGACLCCVEPTNPGAHNVCVCQDGPVFNTRQLLWQD